MALVRYFGEAGHIKNSNESTAYAVSGFRQIVINSLYLKIWPIKRGKERILTLHLKSTSLASAASVTKIHEQDMRGIGMKSPFRE
jgi:hypothetical protein